MPIQACQLNGRDGFRWGKAGRCYVHDGSEEGKARARAKALRQARAILAHGGKSVEIGDMLMNIGGEVKALGNDTVGGVIVRFTSAVDPDLVTDYFETKTDYDSDFPGLTSVYYDHGQDKALQKRKLTEKKSKFDMDPAVGVWVEAQLAMRDAYEEKIYQMAKEGKLGWSTGTASHLVERAPVGKAHRILRWPLGLDASLTPTPAEPRNIAVVSVKAWWDALSADPEVADLATGDESDTIAVEEIKTIRDFEAFLREAGWPKDAAVTIASKGFTALVRRDSGERVSEADRLRLEQIRFAAQRRLRNHEWTGESRL